MLCNKMKLKNSNNFLQLSGKAVQIIDLPGEKVVKIFIEPESVDIILERDEEVSLGDAILIEAPVPDGSIKIISHMPGIL